MAGGLFTPLLFRDALRVIRLFCRRLHCESQPDTKRFITENTEIVQGRSLTPEISLRLFTPKCRFWTERPELWPFPEPFWAIYWPGGQALARYLLNNPAVSKGKRVLDLGCGCGASAIAARLSGAEDVVANDIDPVAVIATQINCELNGLEPLSCVTENMICSEPDNWDLILLGDMFYDESLADCLHKWLHTCIKVHGTQVLIGDPGRAQFESHSIKKLLHKQARFELPDSVKEENYGLTSSTVWSYRPD
ncbi:electron transfer flavoprotein beta subunit lysine methyltransferase [Astyanax mexicanus]|uniref:Electron transfer flavoprotein beta subunit lysine methyltransferase n=2 Tax=Astyanax mexicanus TaxID=7994 RepID=A0A8B9JC63_ASTMX|nr:electron transfer flavoprotein beta subunit lysine methyltransferase [Astyanax mexicanus]KAG9280934.1 electron transfer flavoprotein beta subunit lysine methyltransferase [Astyanax mexicanus]